MKKLNQIFLLLVVAITSTILQAQIVYTEPALPLADEAVTVFFNATGTPLESYTGIIYTHTGLKINGSANWSNVIGEWGDNTVQPDLTPLGDHLYSLEIAPTIRAFYNAEASDVIDQMAFVFRSADGGTQTSPDIFVDVYEAGLNVSISSPDLNPYFVDPGEEISVMADALNSETMSLYVDNALVITVAGT
ncbi:MAG: hypothetical protein R2750_13150, partial [Bacteroidales bacterium]